MCQTLHDALLKVRGAPLCSKACMKAFWPEHKLVCRARRQVAAVDALADELAGLHVDQRSLWLVIPEEQQDLIVEYMDVKSLCRTDSAMTGVEDRKAWQKALKGLESVALNKWPHYSSEDNYKGLRWCRLHRIKLQGFTLEKVVYRRVPQPRDLHFGALCALGRSDIAVLMVETGSIPGGVDSRDTMGGTPTHAASLWGLKDVVSALIEAGADINLANNDSCTPLFIASQEGHVEVVRALLAAGADHTLARDIDDQRKETPLEAAHRQGHRSIVQLLQEYGALA